MGTGLLRATAWVGSCERVSLCAAVGLRCTVTDGFGALSWVYHGANEPVLPVDGKHPRDPLLGSPGTKGCQTLILHPTRGGYLGGGPPNPPPLSPDDDYDCDLPV